MKNLLFLLATVVSLNCFSQDKIVKIPQSELDAFFLALDTLEYQDSIKTILITDLELQLSQTSHLNFTNESIIMNKDSEILMLNDQIMGWCSNWRSRHFNSNIFGWPDPVKTKNIYIYIYRL